MTKSNSLRFQCELKTDWALGFLYVSSTRSGPLSLVSQTEQLLDPLRQDTALLYSSDHSVLVSLTDPLLIYSYIFVYSISSVHLKKPD